MMFDTPPMTNAERQRKFQRAHPGYDVRRKRRVRAAAKRAATPISDALLAQRAAEQQSRTLALPKPLLMLPAPVVDPLTAEINALTETLARTRAAQAV